MENTRKDGSPQHPDDTAPLNEPEQDIAKPIHKVFVDDSVSDEEIAEILWKNRNKSTFK